jgi:hypothetical protein
VLIYGNVYLRDDIMLSLVPTYTNLTRLMHARINIMLLDVVGCVRRICLRSATLTTATR